MGEAVGDFTLELPVICLNRRVFHCRARIKLAFPGGSGKFGHAAQKTLGEPGADKNRTVLSLDEKHGTLANCPLWPRCLARQRSRVARGMAEAKISQGTNVARRVFWRA